MGWRWVEDEPQVLFEKPPESNKLPGGLCQIERCGSHSKPEVPGASQSRLPPDSPRSGGPWAPCTEGKLEEGEGNDYMRGSKTFKRGISSPQPPHAFFTVSICLFRACFQRNQGGLGILTDTCLVVTPPSSHGHVFLGGTTVCVLEVATLSLLDLSKSLDSCQ